MKKYFLIIVSLVILGGCSTTKEPRNLYYAKQEVRAYFEDTTRYLRDVRMVVENAKKYVESNFDPTKNKVAILDIDETSLLNYKYFLKYDFGYSPDTWDEWVDAAEAKANEPVLELYKYLKQKGIKVYFVTGRHESKNIKDPDPTVKNLIEVGYTNFDGIFFKPRTPKMKTAEFKSSIRKKLTEQGYFIFINVGDQYSDFEGNYPGKTFKLPNPAYMTF